LTAEDLRLEFPFRPAAVDEPPAEFAALRAEPGLARVRLPTGDEAWLATRYADVRDLLGDGRLSRAAATAPGAPRLGPARPQAKSLMAMDPPDHTRLRRLLAPAFTRRRMDALRERVEAIAARLVAAMAESGPPADVAEGLSKPLAITVICELLGVPVADRAAFEGWTHRSLALAPSAGDDVEGARAALREYLAELVAARANSSGDDLLATLAGYAGEDRLDLAELAELASTVLTAGYHTVAGAITNSMLVLLRHPAQLALLRDDPAVLPAAVEELLRFAPGPVSGGTIRVATEDVLLGGTQVRAGEAVIPATTSANRDETVFERAGTLDVTRAENPHIAFGHGIHRCLGAPLARIELSAALRALLDRFPGLRLAVEFETLAWRGGAMIGGPRELPIAW
jgi:cytochrome P450